MTIKISNDKYNPQRYQCARFSRCGYSSSHDGGYGDLVWHSGRSLCPACVKFVREVEDSIYNG